MNIEGVNFQANLNDLRNKVKELLLLANKMLDEEMFATAIHSASLALHIFLKSLHLEIYGIVPITSRLRNLVITLAPSGNLENTLKRYIEENRELFEKLENSYKMSLLSEELSKEEALELIEFVNKTIQFLTEMKNRISKELSDDIKRKI